MYSTMCVECADDHFGVGLMHFSRKHARKKDFYYIFVPSDLHLLPLDLKFALPVTLVLGYDSTKLEISTAL